MAMATEPQRACTSHLPQPPLLGAPRYSEAGLSDLQEIMGLLLFQARADGFDNTRRFRRRRVKSGHSVFLMGQPYEGLFVVRLGALKTIVTHGDGSERVRSFAMKGSLLGTDGASNNYYSSEAVALTDCEVILLPQSEFFLPGRTCFEMERMTHWAMSREIEKELSANTTAHSARAEVRVARFLSLQSDEFLALGYSPRRFALPMTRRDIGSYLRLTLETVSRAFSALQQIGIIQVANREISIQAPDALRELHGH
jgi:CRP/FNR family transcriptional regulator